MRGDADGGTDPDFEKQMLSKAYSPANTVELADLGQVATLEKSVKAMHVVTGTQPLTAVLLLEQRVRVAHPAAALNGNDDQPVVLNFQCRLRCPEQSEVLNFANFKYNDRRKKIYPIKSSIELLVLN